MGPDLEPERATPLAAVWEHVRHQDARIEALETWRVRSDAVSGWLRRNIALAISIVAIALTAVDLFLKYRH